MNYPEFNVSVPVVFGRGAIAALGERVKELGCKKALCVYEKGVEGAGISDKALASLKAAGVEYATFNGVISDPTDAVVDAAAAAAKAAGADVFIGIGGGSSMDTAKAAAIAFETGKAAKEFILARPITINIKTPVVLVPTTAGTGSEVTAVAIISIPEVNGKWSVFTNTTLAVLDPELTFTLPKRETANTGLDALAHATEAMTTINHNIHSDLFGEAATRKIAKWLKIAYSEPSNTEARTEMMLAANFAGFAFNNPITHVGHASADAFSVKFHTPHGYNCAISLPEALALVAPELPGQAKLIAEALGIKLNGSESGEKLGALIADNIRQLMRDVEIKSLKELGYSRSDITALAHEVAQNHLSDFSPVKITDEVAEALLGRIYDTYQ
ncbi:MAG: iron-containing alcohol dehydrogenase [Oscillospiraceae bacterium]|nr:iron-containing alcohol dehydrogenase [Oscillospiraceae bacterium]